MDLEFLEKKGVIKLLLYFLDKEPLRFRDLKQVLFREATLSQRIRDLEELALIEAVPIKDGRRNFFAYKLTEEGMRITQKLQEI